jgi:CDGSH-type Zn-finger protein
MLNQDVPSVSPSVKEYKVIILPKGPYLVKGRIPINKVKVTFDSMGIPLGYEVVESYPIKDVQSLCRCGKSQNMPFCDGSHLKHEFEGRETAERTLFRDKARTLIGRNLILLDYRELCMGVGFCHRAGSTWVLTRLSDDPEKRALAIETAQLCPSGRLVACDKETEEPIEPELEPSISIIQDSRVNVSGPIWLKGGIPVESADGECYEVRFRVTLCSCGKSRMMPFCDGRHYFA